jgi:hypothetical protein
MESGQQIDSADCIAVFGFQEGSREVPLSSVIDKRQALLVLAYFHNRKQKGWYGPKRCGCLMGNAC